MILGAIAKAIAAAGGLLFEPVRRIRVVYKNGHVHEFDCTSFSRSAQGSYYWTAVSEQNKPVVFGATEIAAVWQIRSGWRLRNPLKKLKKEEQRA